MELKIHVYTICWNEAKMLPHFLRYYSAFCEKIYVYDNCSTDDSVALCNEFPKVQTKSYYTNNQIRDDIYAKIKNESWKNSRGKCDYVIVCDVDEFVYHPEIITFLKDSHSRGVSLFRCRGYNMIAAGFPPKDSNILQTVREGVRSKSFDKWCVFDPNKIEEINYEFGSHNCLPIGELQFSTDQLILLHYKFMGLSHTLARYKEMGKRLSRFNKKWKLGHHYLFSSRKIRSEFNEIWKDREQVI